MSQGKVHLLRLSYEEFVEQHRSIENTIIDRYCIYEQIDSGNFGSVYRGMDTISKKVVAIKVLDLKAVQKEPNLRIKSIKKKLCRTESELMMKCNSPNLVKCYDVYENTALKIMVIQYCNGGTLHNQIQTKDKIDERQALAILRQIINGLTEMHKKVIIHRDLKAENILSHNGIYKIADLGFAKQMELGQSNNQNQEIQQTILGTMTTMAPEVVRKRPYGLKADIWSLGVVFYQMLAGEAPYISTNATNMSAQMLSKKIFIKDQIKNHVRPSPEVLKFLKQLMQPDTSRRLCWKQIISHQVFKQQYGLIGNFRIIAQMEAPPITNIQLTEEEHQQLQNKIIRQNNDQKPKELVRVPKYVINSKKQEIDNEDDRNFQWAKQTHLQCLKTQIIFQKLFKPIQRGKVLKDERETTEFMYLLLTRCLMNMNPIKQKVQKNPHCQAIQQLEKTVKQLSAEVSRQWKQYSDLLTKKQSMIFQIVSDRWAKIMNKNNYEQKDKFLTGIEQIEYTKVEQIKFTVSKYIPKIRQQYKNRHQEVQRILNKYKDICQIKLEEVKNQKFEDYIQVILK